MTNARLREDIKENCIYLEANLGYLHPNIVNGFPFTFGQSTVVRLHSVHRIPINMPFK